MNKHTLIINLFGGPGVGKSTLAAGVFYKLKILKYDVELVTEYAKELVYENRFNVLKQDQLYIFAKQNRKIQRCIESDQLDFIVTDSALIHSAIYNQYSDNPEPSEFNSLCIKKFNNYNNYNVLLHRCFEYNENGRYQDESGALDIDNKIKQFLNDNVIAYTYTPINETTLDNITNSAVVLYNKLKESYTC